MKLYEITSDAGIEQLQITTRDRPAIKSDQVLLKLHAASLNYRDLMVAGGGYPRNDSRPVIALSDGAGEIIEVGNDVSSWKVGDRVMPNFMRDWIDGPVDEKALKSGLGGGVDGVLAEYIAVDAQALVAIPEHLSYAEAATLPCAALTAWNALESAGTSKGDTVLILGTGGVALFGIAFAKALGARTIVTSRSEAKLKAISDLGVDDELVLPSDGDYSEPVLKLTNEKGVDHVLDIGGPGSIERSLKATRVGGTVSLIGVLDTDSTSILPALLNAQRIQVIYVGSVEMFTRMARFIADHQLRPHIDRTFTFAAAKAAYHYLAEQKHTGKVVIEFT